MPSSSARKHVAARSFSAAPRFSHAPVPSSVLQAPAAHASLESGSDERHRRDASPEDAVAGPSRPRQRAGGRGRRRHAVPAFSAVDAFLEAMRPKETSSNGASTSGALREGGPSSFRARLGRWTHRIVEAVGAAETPEQSAEALAPVAAAIHDEGLRSGLVFNEAIKSLLAEGRAEVAEAVAGAMPAAGVPPDLITYTLLCRYWMRRGDAERAHHWLWVMGHTGREALAGADSAARAAAQAAAGEGLKPDRGLLSTFARGHLALLDFHAAAHFLRALVDAGHAGEAAEAILATASAALRAGRTEDFGQLSAYLAGSGFKPPMGQFVAWIGTGGRPETSEHAARLFALAEALYPQCTAPEAPGAAESRARVFNACLKAVLDAAEGPARPRSPSPGRPTSPSPRRAQCLLEGLAWAERAEGELGVPLGRVSMDILARAHLRAGRFAEASAWVVRMARLEGDARPEWPQLRSLLWALAEARQYALVREAAEAAAAAGWPLDAPLFGRWLRRLLHEDGPDGEEYLAAFALAARCLPPEEARSAAWNPRLAALPADEAVAALSQVPSPDAASYAAVMRSLTRAGRADAALALAPEGLAPEPFLVNARLEALLAADDKSAAWALLAAMERAGAGAPAEGDASGLPPPDRNSYRAFVASFLSEGRVEDARRVHGRARRHGVALSPNTLQGIADALADEGADPGEIRLWESRARAAALAGRLKSYAHAHGPGHGAPGRPRH
eukprot:tig00020723_g13520.t1